MGTGRRAPKAARASIMRLIQSSSRTFSGISTRHTLVKTRANRYLGLGSTQQRPARRAQIGQVKESEPQTWQCKKGNYIQEGWQESLTFFTHGENDVTKDLASLMQGCHCVRHLSTNLATLHQTASGSVSAANWPACIMYYYLKATGKRSKKDFLKCSSGKAHLLW